MKYFKNFLISLILIVAGYLIIANIEHVVMLNTKYTINYSDNNPFEEFSTTMKKLKTNIAKLDKITNVDNISAADLKTLKENVTTMYNGLYKTEFVDKTGKEVITYKKFYTIVENNNENTGVLNIINMYKILGKYETSGIDKLVISAVIDCFFNNALTDDSYKTTVMYDDNFDPFNVDSLPGVGEQALRIKMSELAIEYNLKANTLLYITEYLIEGGTTNE